MLLILILIQTKDIEQKIQMAEAGAVLILSAAAYLMSLKDKISLKKLEETDT